MGVFQNDFLLTIMVFFSQRASSTRALSGNVYSHDQCNFCGELSSALRVLVDTTQRPHAEALWPPNQLRSSQVRCLLDQKVNELRHRNSYTISTYLLTHLVRFAASQKNTTGKNICSIHSGEKIWQNLEILFDLITYTRVEQSLNYFFPVQG